jgi:hypothetical protein
MGLQVLRYGPTNQYKAHLDGLERVATVLIYLIPPEKGGETAFPKSNGWLHPEMGEPRCVVLWFIPIIGQEVVQGVVLKRCSFWGCMRSG